MIEKLCKESTSCNGAGNNDDYHRSSQRQMVNTRVTWMEISFDHLQYTGTFIVLSCINVNFFSILPLYLALYAHY